VLVRRFFPLSLVFALACSEDLTGGNTCPSLCPTENIPLQEVVIEPVAVAASAGDFPLRGREAGLWIASRGDSLDVRAIIRFDTVTSTYSVNNTASPIESLDSAHVHVRFSLVDVGWTGDITLEAYDVDATAADTSSTALAELFRPDRFLGSTVVSAVGLLLDDSVKVYLPNDFLLAKIKGGQRVRIGLRLAGAGHALLQSVETGAPPRLSFRPAPGVAEARQINVAPISRTPTGDAALAADLADYTIFVRGTEAVDDARLAAGGLPSRRGYLRLVIPSFYLDSVVLVRAQLTLTQRPSGSIDRTVPIAVVPVAVSAGSTVVDIRRAASLVYPALQFGINAIVAAPADSGERRIDLIQLVRQWASVPNRANGPQTSIVLQSLSEGTGPGLLEFYGPDAPEALRPKLRLSFIPRARFGRP
jgi:hypothetical protein